MEQQNLVIDGIDVYVEGTGATTILLLHGWPDSYRLWDGTVAALKEQHRCVRFTLPGFDMGKPARPISLADMTALITRVVNTVSPEGVVTLLMHDWGCTYGYEFAAKHPDKVVRMVAVDIGDHNSGAFLHSLSASAKLSIFVYQVWLAMAWKVGSIFSVRLGDLMTRFMARIMRCPTPANAIGWQLNYPYAMQWFGLLGGLGGAAKVSLTHPILYIYGRRKPFMFHSPKWLKSIDAAPGSKVQEFKTGHWIMVDQPVEFIACIRGWL
jgi:pimeloyl-ACP methyl ester carboxylesterase